MADTQNRIGQAVGDYQLQRLLGKGTFGTVYLADHLHDHTSAVVKLLHIPLTSRDALHTFLNEARTIRLRHPHIVPILDFGLSRYDDLPYLVMAYADGGTLRDRYPKGSKLSHKTIDTYVQQLASALQYAHDHRVIHRDVKPQNMLVYTDGTVQLSDFGIAKISELAALASLHKIVGTPAYAAPEQTQGKPCPASDQYALAIVAYEWLAGQRPFQGDPLSIMLHHRVDAPPSLRSICPGVSLQVEQVIFKALAKAPEDRFPTITHFAEALHTALQADATQPLSHLGQPSSAPSPTVPAPLPEVPLLQVIPSGAPLVLTEIAFSPQAVSPSVDTPSVGPVGVLQSPWPGSNRQKRLATSPLLRALIVLLCLLLLLGGGGATWLVVTQQQAHDAATAAANAYWTGVARNGVQFGFDAAHTHWNPYERVLNKANVAHITQLWSFPSRDRIFSSPAVANGMVYVGARNHSLYAFDATCHRDCQPLWSFDLGSQVSSSPAVANGMVYISSWEGSKLSAFDATCRKNCQPLWSFTTEYNSYSSPTVANGMVYVGSGDHRFYAYDASCRQGCQPLWSFTTGGSVFSSPAVANGMVYVGSWDRNLYAFDASCRQGCQPLWSFTTGGEIFSSPAVANGMVYVGSLDRKLYVFDASCRQSCQPLWSFTTGDAIWSSPAVANGMVYIGSYDGKLYAFDATCHQDCQPLWSFKTGGDIEAALTVANGVGYVGSRDGTLYAFDAICRQDCQPLWWFSTGRVIDSSPAVANGVVYVGSGDGTLYAFGLPASP
jgi:serine/threonine protein kinase/outer membrane protein assembly factor BamB